MSQTLLLSHMYPNTPEALALANDEPWDDDMYDRAQQHLEAIPPGTTNQIAPLMVTLLILTASWHDTGHGWHRSVLQ